MIRPWLAAALAAALASALTCLPLARQAAASEAPADYATLPGARAMARPLNGNAAPTVVQAMPNDLTAALQALQRCQAAAGVACELERLNHERITTGAEIRAALPDDPHPLFLWRLRRDGTVVYLAGSIHVLKPSLYPLPAPFEAAFRAADHLVLEVNLAALSEPEIQRQTLSRARLPAGTTLHGLLPPDLQATLQAALPAYGLTLEALDGLRPALVMNQLVVARLMSLGYLPDSGLESHFLARAGTREVLELESLEAQLTLLLDQPMDTQLALLADAVATAPEVEPLLTGLVTAWLAGDDARFLELFRAQSGDAPELAAFQRALLDDRNVDMAARIAALLTAPAEAPPATYFVLVGAAHLVGRAGVVALLEERGFQVERIRSDAKINRRTPT